MANLSFTLSDLDLTRAVNGVCAYGNYQATIPNPTDPTKTISNPETKSVFAKRMLIDQIKQMVAAGEQKKAEQNARATLNVTEPSIT